MGYYKDVFSMKYDCELNHQKEINKLPQIMQDKTHFAEGKKQEGPMLYYDYGLVDCPAIICGKYRFIAEIFELLDSEVAEYIKQNNFETKIGEQLITSMKNGISNYYTLENQDLLLLKGLLDEYKKNKQTQEKKMKAHINPTEYLKESEYEMPYDYINIEQFFLYLDYMHKLMKQYQYYVKKETMDYIQYIKSYFAK